MRSRLLGITGVVAGASLLFTLLDVPSARADDASVPYPDGYRSWTFLHSSIVPPQISGFAESPCVKPCTNGIFHFFANEKAMRGLQTGTYENGAVIAMELLEFLLNEKGYGEEGRRVRTAVMAKDSDRYDSTGGWGFGRFDEGSKTNTLDTKAQQACYHCHAAQKNHGYVFTRYNNR